MPALMTDKAKVYLLIKEMHFHGKSQALRRRKGVLKC